MTRALFPQNSRTGYSRYVEGLRDAIRHRDWVTDPSFALASDSAVYEKVMRDPVAAHAVRFRKHLVAGAEVRVQAASERPEDQAAAAVIEDLLRQVQGFTDARICLADAIFRGSAYAFVEGRRSFLRAGTLPGGGEPVGQTWWVPERLRDVDRRRFRLVRAGEDLRWELWSVERGRWEVLQNPEWFVRSVHENTEASLGYGRALFDTLYVNQASKARALQDWAAASERYGQGFVTIAIENLRGADGRPVGGDQRGSDTVAQAWATEFAKHKARHVFTHDKRDEVQVHDSSFGRGWQLLGELISYYDNAQVTAVLGATLPTLEGDGGSRAMAAVQENSTEALIQADRARLADDLTRDLVGLLWRLNRAQLANQVGEATMPRLVIDQRKREDPQEAARIVFTLLQAGVPLVAEEVYKKTGFSVPLPGDETILPPASQPGSLLPMGDMGEASGGLSVPTGELRLPGALPSPGGGSTMVPTPGTAAAEPLNGDRFGPAFPLGVG